MAEFCNRKRLDFIRSFSETPPPLDNLAIAAKFLTSIFDLHNIENVIRGGFAVLLRGSGLLTDDVDIAVRCGMNRVVEIIREHGRLFIPQSQSIARIPIFIQTGGDWDPGYDFTIVRADIIISGNLGSPVYFNTNIENINPVLHNDLVQPIDTFRGAEVRVGIFQTPDRSLRPIKVSYCTEAVYPGPAILETEVFRVFTPFYQFSTHLFAYHERKFENDYNHLIFLVTSIPTEIVGFWDQLIREHREYFRQQYSNRNRSAKKRNRSADSVSELEDILMRRE